MLFSIILIVLALLIVFYHFIQGFFTSLLSAIIALMAAGVAIAYYEPFTRLMKPTGFADDAEGLLMAVLFGATYILLRVIFDMLVPGNVRLQSTVDKVGAVLFGVIAAICCTGIIAIAAQSLPFGPSVLGFSRYKMIDHAEVSLPGLGDFEVNDLLQGDKLAPSDRLSLTVPFDQMTLNLVGAMSDDGLSGSRTLYSVHPDLLQEFFANNLGYQVGSRHSAWNYGDAPQVTIGSPQEAPILRVVDDEIPGFRAMVPRLDALPKDYKSGDGKILLLIPCTFSAQAIEADGGSVVRIATGSVRLVTPDKDDPTGFTDHYPLGTADLHDGILFASKPDDPIFVDVNAGRGEAIFAFLLDRGQVLQDPAAKTPELADGVSIDVKRLVMQDLSGVVKPADLFGKQESTVVYKTKVLELAGIAPKSKTAGGSKTLAPPIVAAPAAAKGPIEIKQAETSDQLPGAVNAGSAGKLRLDANVMAEIKNQRLVALTVRLTEPVNGGAAGAFMVQSLYVPKGDKLIQLRATPKGEPWGWAGKFADFTLVDKDGKKYSINGLWGHAKMPDGSVHFFAQYQSSHALSAQTDKIDVDSSATPTELWLAFLVPQNADITQLNYNGEKYADLNAVK